MARIGIFGGSFNPPHRGHVLALQEFKEKLGLDELFVIPANDPPHKTLSANSPDALQRFVLTELATEECWNDAPQQKQQSHHPD